MPSFKINFGMIHGLPNDPQVVQDKLAAFGCPPEAIVGVLESSIKTLKKADGDVIYIEGNLVVAKNAKLPKVDRAAKEVTTKSVQRDDLLPFRIYQHIADGGYVLETTKGGLKGNHKTIIGLLQTAFPNESGLEEKITIDTSYFDASLSKYLERLQALTSGHRVKSATLKKYEAEDGVTGGYTAIFTDNATGVDFIDRNDDKTSSVSVAYSGGGGNVKTKLTTSPSFSFSSKEEDESEVYDVLRQVVQLKPMGVLASVISESANDEADEIVSGDE